MRRPISILLLVLMLAALIAPVAVATVTAPTPACCRAGGRHHCSATAASLVPSGIRLQGQSCPYRKHLAFSVSAAPPPAAETVAPVGAHSVLHQFYSEVFISRRELPHSQRGPPHASAVK